MANTASNNTPDGEFYRLAAALDPADPRVQAILATDGKTAASVRMSISTAK